MIFQDISVQSRDVWHVSCRLKGILCDRHLFFLRPMYKKCKETPETWSKNKIPNFSNLQIVQHVGGLI